MHFPFQIPVLIRMAAVRMAAVPTRPLLDSSDSKTTACPFPSCKFTILSSLLLPKWLRSYFPFRIKWLRSSPAPPAPKWLHSSVFTFPLASSLYCYRFWLPDGYVLGTFLLSKIAYLLPIDAAIHLVLFSLCISFFCSGVCFLGFLPDVNVFSTLFFCFRRPLILRSTNPPLAEC